MSYDDPNDFLNSGGGAPGVKFPTIGTAVKGVVQKAEVNQQTDMKTGEPKFYKDGNPMKQLVVTLQTDDRDPSIEGDTGLRRLFVKGQMKSAIAEAVKAANAKLDLGGTLIVQFVSEKASETRGFDPAKQFEARYVAPATNAANDHLGVDTPAPAAPAKSIDDLV